ncbi:MAG: hypothetical protein CMH62_01465 [Nanoarchaeota archaeon]|nr:hypothetical protein [Nanoarchaeota archaeon]|tara:strand:+ start:34 stop:726 length:693 start_codon:yes stop_codon:yes gene_type:complete
MDINKRNKLNVISRWKKLQDKDRKFIKNNREKTKHLKSRICGFLAGDGNILKSNNKTCTHNTVRFFPDDKSLVESFNKALSLVYNKEAKIKNKGKFYWVYIDSKVIVEDLLKTTTFDKLNWKVPKIKTKKEKIEWLKAYFDCEAHVNKKIIVVKSVNKMGLVQVKNLLKEFDITSKIYNYKPKNKNWNTNFILIISKKEDRRKYLKKIGFNHTIKLKKLNKIINNYAAIA